MYVVVRMSGPGARSNFNIIGGVDEAKMTRLPKRIADNHHSAFGRKSISLTLPRPHPRLLSGVLRDCDVLEGPLCV